MRTARLTIIAIAAAALVLCAAVLPAAALAPGGVDRAVLVPGRAHATAEAAVSQVAQVRAIAAAALAAEQQVAAEAGYSAATHAKKKAAKSKAGDAARAQAILASLKSRYPRYLAGVTVSMGNASGYQAVAYYTSGRIVISPKHKASLERILGHEVWHIIDWRDNGRIDWREKVPPANASSYR
jgi:hypothetical protein